MKALKQVNSLK